MALSAATDRGGRRWRQLGRGLAGAFQQLSTRPGVRAFVILFVPRTGSNLLAGMLDSHPEILCHHELFLPDSPHRSLSVREGLVSLDLGTANERDRDPFAFLQRVFAMDAGCRAVGFKMALSDVNVGVLLALILNRGIRKIVVRRDNWLNVYTSALIAERSDFIRFAADGGTSAKGEGPTRVSVDVDQFIRYTRKRVASYAVLRHLLTLTRQPYFEIEYEEIPRPDKLRVLLRFLGVAPELAVRERTLKQNPSRLEDRIENYSEVVERLSDTSYARLLA